ncbi:hypothetical protein [Longispora urticae]
MYTDLRDFEPDFVFQYDSRVYGEVWIEVEKVGGGYVGDEYPGLWGYRIWDNPAGEGEPLTQGRDLEAGSPINHMAAGKTALNMFEEGEE